MTPIDLTGLETATKNLNVEVDDLNGVYTTLQSRLAEMKIGVFAWTGRRLDERFFVETRDAQFAGDGLLKTHVTTGWEFSYAEVDDQWALAVREVRGEHEQGTDHEDCTWSEGEPMPLLKASRTIRLEAAQHLEVLVAAIQHKIDRFAKDIDNAKELAKSLASDGGQSLPGGGS